MSEIQNVKIIDKRWVKFEGIEIKFGLVPVLVTTGAIAVFIIGPANVLRYVGDFVFTNVGKGAEYILAKTPEVLKTFSTGIQKHFPNILGNVVDAAGTVLGAVIDGLDANSGKIVNTITKSIPKIAELSGKVFITVVKSLPELAEGLGANLLDNIFGPMYDELQKIITFLPKREKRPTNKIERNTALDNQLGEQLLNQQKEMNTILRGGGGLRTIKV